MNARVEKTVGRRFKNKIMMAGKTFKEKQTEAEKRPNFNMLVQQGERNKEGQKSFIMNNKIIKNPFHGSCTETHLNTSTFNYLVT